MQLIAMLGSSTGFAQEIAQLGPESQLGDAFADVVRLAERVPLQDFSARHFVAEQGGKLAPSLEIPIEDQGDEDDASAVLEVLLSKDEPIISAYPEAAVQVSLAPAPKLGDAKMDRIENPSIGRSMSDLIEIPVGLTPRLDPVDEAVGEADSGGPLAPVLERKFVPDQSFLPKVAPIVTPTPFEQALTRVPRVLPEPNGGLVEAQRAVPMGLPEAGEPIPTPMGDAQTVKQRDSGMGRPFEILSTPSSTMNPDKERDIPPILSKQPTPVVSSAGPSSRVVQVVPVEPFVPLDEVVAAPPPVSGPGIDGQKLALDSQGKSRVVANRTVDFGKTTNVNQEAKQDAVSLVALPAHPESGPPQMPNPLGSVSVIPVSSDFLIAGPSDSMPPRRVFEKLDILRSNTAAPDVRGSAKQGLISEPRVSFVLNDESRYFPSEEPQVVESSSMNSAPTEGRNEGIRAATTLFRPTEIAREILFQIRASAPTDPFQTVEIQLNPEELGKVRISLAAQDSGGVVSILVERPETLELMRRNIDQLLKEFRGAGWSEIEFSLTQQGFGQNSNDSDTRDGAHARHDGREETVGAGETSPYPPATRQTQAPTAHSIVRLDLRI